MSNSSDPHRTPRYWDEQAGSFDDEPDHGLRDQAVRDAWRKLLMAWLPPGGATILDIGCGTGSLSLLLADMGYRVTGTDWSQAMIARARIKAIAAGQTAQFVLMDAATPGFASGRFDMVLCRHLLWALPEPARVLRNWTRLLALGGWLILIEGFWHTGGGLHAREVARAIPSYMANIQVHDLSRKPHLWRGEVTDERYGVTAQLVSPTGE